MQSETGPCLPNCLRPCRATFDRLAREAPELLIAWVQTGYGLGDAELSFACEAVGTVERQVSSAINVLIGYVGAPNGGGHQSPVVREGAVLGLAAHERGPLRGWTFAWPALRWAAEHDPSPGVRAAASDAFEGRTRKAQS
jgi:hypothetical protein